MDGPWKHFGKQVFCAEEHMADATTEGAADLIAQLCNRAYEEPDDARPD